MEKFSLAGKRIRLEPLERHHADALLAASEGEEAAALYEWSAVPRGKEQVAAYIDKALAGREAGIVAPFVTIRLQDERVLGSTRFFDIERWAWPKGSDRLDAGLVDGCEIGYTWLAPSAIRTGVNTEAKLLMLTHAFEKWQALRVCLHTDSRNQRSAAAMERIGATFEGLLRSHRLATDGTARNSLRYSIVASDWPEVKRKLEERLARG